MGLVVGEVPLPPLHLRVPSKASTWVATRSRNPPVVADHDRAAGEGQERLLQRAESVHVEVIGRFVEKQHLPPARNTLANCTRLRSPPEKLSNLLLLVAALEAEAGQVSAAVGLPAADEDPVLTSSRLFEDRLAGFQFLT